MYTDIENLIRMFGLESKNLSTSITFRKFKPSDQKYVYKMSIDAFEYYRNLDSGYKKQTDLEYNSIIKSIEVQSKGKGVDIFIADNSGYAVGFCLVHTEGNTTVIDDMYVDAKFRGRGIGKGLLETVRSNSLGKSLKLQVFKSNQAAYKLYKKFGFKLKFIVTDVENDFTIYEMVYI